jgi:hypothetical protein
MDFQRKTGGLEGFGWNNRWLISIQNDDLKSIYTEKSFKTRLVTHID